MAPAVTFRANPGPMDDGAPAPAVASPTTASRTGPSRVAGAMSSARTAYPSRAAWSKAGSSRRLTTSSAQSRPWASRTASSIGSTSGTAPRISSRCRSTVRTWLAGVGGGDGMRSRSICVVSRWCAGAAVSWTATVRTTVPRRRSICVVSRGPPILLSSLISTTVVAPRRPALRGLLATDGAPASAGGAGGAPSSGQLGDELGEPGPQRRAQVVALGGQPDDRLEVVQPVAGVVPAAAEDDAVHRLPALDQRGQRVGQLDLPAPAGRGVPQHLEDLRGQHVAPDDRQAAGGLLDRRLLHQPGDADDVVALAGVVAGLDRHRAVLVDVLPADVEQGDHRAAALGLDGEHLLQQQV